MNDLKKSLEAAKQLIEVLKDPDNRKRLDERLAKRADGGDFIEKEQKPEPKPTAKPAAPKFKQPKPISLQPKPKSKKQELAEIMKRDLDMHSKWKSRKESKAK